MKMKFWQWGAIYLLGCGAYALFLYSAFVHFEPPEGVRIDCSTAEFNPDFTPQMREACRNVRKHKL
jgi:hypothetical protein